MACLERPRERLPDCPPPHQVVHKLLERLTMLCDDDPVLRKLQKGPLAVWASLILEALAGCADAPAGVAGVAGVAGAVAGAEGADGESCALQVALVRLLRLFIQMLPRALLPNKEAILPPLGAQLLRAVRLHERTLEATEPGGAMGLWNAPSRYDSDGETEGADALAAELLDVFSALADSSTFHRLLTPALPDLFHMCI